MGSNVAVVGPFYNAESHARDWLAALEAQDYSNFKIYAVDDASSDRSATFLNERKRFLRDRFELISLARNQGPSAARNHAIRRALDQGADLILLLDADCRVPPNWISQHVDFHLQKPEIAIAGGAIAGSAHSIIGTADGYCSWFTAVPHAPAGPVLRLHLSSTNMSLKREAFDRIGYFDETLATGEDVAFCRKAQKAGLKLWFEGAIVATHLDRNDYCNATKHHFRWGLHSYTLATQQQGGYYGVLKIFKKKWPVLALVPAVAILNTILILFKFTRHRPTVWFYTPWIFYLKWWNAIGVYRGFVDPRRCLRS